ncbi:MAG: hypothetical protein QOI84_922 [Solirubrobacterales bacterium]|jgi:hypothetical protein|nr:hypothetical protein [Solirubrobacterales bacterium]
MAMQESASSHSRFHRPKMAAQRGIVRGADSFHKS